MTEAVLVDKLIGNSYLVVRYVATQIEYIKHVSDHLAEIYRVHASIEAVDSIVEHIATLDEILEKFEDILAVGNAIGEVSAVGTNLTQILAVHAELNKLLTLFNNLTPLTEVADAIVEVTAVGANITAIIAVYGKLGELQDIHTNLDTLLEGIETLGGIDTRVTALETATEGKLDPFTGDSGSGGSAGLVPSPEAGDTAAGKFLEAGGGFSSPLSKLFTSSRTGAVPYLISKQLDSIFNVRQLGAIGEADAGNASADTAAFNKIADAGGTVWIPKGTYYLNAPIVIDSPVMVMVESGVVINVLHNGAGFQVTSSDVYFEGFGFPVINGPRTGTEFVEGNRAFSFAGASSGSRISRGAARGFRILNFKDGGTHALFADDIYVEQNNISLSSYFGSFFLSCDDINYLNNDVSQIGPGTGGGASTYGVALTASVGQPVCTDFLIAGNRIEKVYRHTGIDTHGGQNGRIIGNKIYDCRIGVGVTVLSSEVPAAILVNDNDIVGHPKAGVSYNGETVYSSEGIYIAGVPGSSRADGCSVSNNRLKYCGRVDSGNRIPAIGLQTVRGTICMGNILISPNTDGIATFYSNIGFDIVNNHIFGIESFGVEVPSAVHIWGTQSAGTLRGNTLVRSSSSGTAYLYEIDDNQEVGWSIGVSRDGYAHNATKWAPDSSSRTGVVDLDSAL